MRDVRVSHKISVSIDRSLNKIDAEHFAQIRHTRRGTDRLRPVPLSNRFSSHDPILRRPVEQVNRRVNREIHDRAQASASVLNHRYRVPERTLGLKLLPIRAVRPAEDGSPGFANTQKARACRDRPRKSALRSRQGMLLDPGPGVEGRHHLARTKPDRPSEPIAQLGARIDPEGVVNGRGEIGRPECLRHRIGTQTV